MTIIVSSYFLSVCCGFLQSIFMTAGNREGAVERQLALTAKEWSNWLWLIPVSRYNSGEKVSDNETLVITQ